MTTTKAGFEAEAKNKISPEAIQSFLDSEVKNYKIIAIVTTEVKIPEVPDIKVDKNTLSIEEPNNHQLKAGGLV